MHRTQISLDEPTYEALRRLAYERRRSMSQLVREALAAYVAAAPPRDPVPRDRERGTREAQPRGPAAERP